MMVASRLRADLAQMAERFGEADRRALRAAALCDDGELSAAEAERREAAGDYHAATEGLADLLLMLLRFALSHRPDALRGLLVDALRPQDDRGAGLQPAGDEEVARFLLGLARRPGAVQALRRILFRKRKGR